MKLCILTSYISTKSNVQLTVSCKVISGILMTITCSCEAVIVHWHVTFTNNSQMVNITPNSPKVFVSSPPHLSGDNSAVKQKKRLLARARHSM